MNWQLDESKFLTQKEVKQLRDAAKKKATPAERFLLELGLATGLRVAEMAALRIGDFAVSSGRNSLLVRSGKGGKSRVVKLPPYFKRVLKDYIRQKEKAGEPTDAEAPLFYSRRTGGALSVRALQKAFKRLLLKAGLDAEKFSIHCLRHTYAVELFRASGWNLRLVQQQLGHSTIMVTEVYANLFSPVLTAALSNLWSQ